MQKFLSGQVNVLITAKSVRTGEGEFCVVWQHYTVNLSTNGGLLQSLINDMSVH